MQNPPSVCNENLSATVAAVIAAINAQFEAGYAIRFRAFEEQRHGFDSLRYTPMADDYNYLTVAGQPYNVAWKSVEAGGTDSVSLATPFADLPADLTFETNAPTPVPHHPHAPDGSCVLPIHGTTHEDTYQIYPVQTRTDAQGNPEKKYAGKLNVVSYERKHVEVVLVPVNGAGAHLTEADRAAMEVRLNEIYAPAVVGVGVELGAPINVPSFDDTLDVVPDGHHSLWDYTAEMRRIVQAVRSSNGYDRNKFYLAMVAESADGQVVGDMPHGKNIGFLVSGLLPNNAALSRTIAHELGHGAFWLNHTFEEYPTLTPGATDNLMDYSAGTALYKKQWDIIHNPSLIVRLGAEENSSSVTVDVTSLANLKNPDGSYTFITPAGKPITIDGDRLRSVTFFSGDDINFGSQSNVAFNLAPLGTLHSFTYELTEENIVTYLGCGSNVSRQFEGYHYQFSNNDCTGDWFVDTKTTSYRYVAEGENPADKAIIGFPYFRNRLYYLAGHVSLSHPKVIRDGLTAGESPSAQQYGGKGSLAAYDIFLPRSQDPIVPGHQFFPPFVMGGETARIESQHLDSQLSNSYEAMNFLRAWTGGDAQNLDVPSPGDEGDPAAVHIMIHAQQIALYPDLFRVCSVDVPVLVRLKDAYEVSTAFSALNADTDTDAQRLGSSLRAILETSNTSAWINAGFSIYKEYFDQYNPVAQDAFFNSLVVGDDASENRLVSFLAGWIKSECAFVNLSPQNRRKAIHVLANDAIIGTPSISSHLLTRPGFFYSVELPDTNPNHPLLFESNEYLLNALIKSARDSAGQHEILTFFFGENYQDPSNYFAIESVINTPFFSPIYYSDGKGYEDFVATLTHLVLLDQYNDLKPVLLDGDLYLTTNNMFSTPVYEVVTHYMGGGGTIFEDDIAGNFTVSRNGNRIQLRSTFGNYVYGSIPTGPSTPINSENYPYDFVIIHFVDGYSTPLPGYPQGVQAGAKVAVPAMFAAMMFRKQNNATFNHNVRIAGDVLAVCFGFGALNTASTAWRIVAGADVVMGVFDAIVMAPDQYVFDFTGQSDIPQGLHNLWIGMMAASGAGQISATFVPGITRFFRHINGKWQIAAESAADMAGGIRSLHQSSPATFRQQMAELRTGLQQSQAQARAVNNQPVVLDLQARIDVIDLERSTLHTPGELNNHYYRIQRHNDNLLHVVDRSTQGSSPIPFANIIREPDGSATLSLRPGVAVSEAPAATRHLGTIENVPAQIDGTTGILTRGELYLDDVTNTVRVVVRTGDFITNLQPPYSIWYNFLTSRTWVLIWDDFFTGSTPSRFAGLVANHPDVNYAQLFALIEARGWDAAKMRHFMELDDTRLGRLLFDEPAQVTARAGAWGDLYSPTDHLLSDALIDAYLHAGHADRVAGLHAFVRESQERANIFKALYRSGFNDGAAALNPPRDNRDWLMRMFKDGDRGISASFEDGQAIFRMASGGGSDEIVRITAQGDILADATRVAEGWNGRSIVHISDDGSRAIVCASGNCELVVGACFPAGTPIHTPTGSVPIEKISIGDTVMAYDEILKTPTLAAVTNVFQKSWHRLVRVIAGLDTLMATPNHPFYLPGLSRYVPADSLRRGMQLLALSGALLTVQSVAALDTTVSVYNFEVAEHHNYYVGAEGVLVHNDCVFVKAGLKSADGVPPADDFDIINQAFLSELGVVQTDLARLEIRELLTGANGEALTAFFRGDDLAATLSVVERRAAQMGRVKACEAMLDSDLATNVPALTKLSAQISEHPAKLDDFKARFAIADDAGKQQLINELEWFFGFKPGYFKEDITAIPKGSRPDPTTYLTPNYISNHLAQFNAEGGAFLVVRSWIESGSYSSFPPKKFAMLRSDMQSVLDDYAASRDVSVLERGLGYNPNDLVGHEDELYVFFTSSSQYNFRMPTGNEIGANNLWEAGGFTSPGIKKEATMEGLTDPNEAIVHNKDINELINQFEYVQL